MRARYDVLWRAMTRAAEADEISEIETIVEIWYTACMRKAHDELYRETASPRIEFRENPVLYCLSGQWAARQSALKPGCFGIAGKLSFSDDDH